MVSLTSKIWGFFWMKLFGETWYFSFLEKMEQWGGYVRHNTIYREVYNMNKEIIDDEFITENHAITMYEPFLTQGE